VAVEASRWLHDFPRAGLLPPVTVVPDIDTVSATNADMTTDEGHPYWLIGASGERRKKDDDDRRRGVFGEMDAVASAVPLSTFSVSYVIQSRMLEIRQTDVYAKWFASLRDRTAKVRIDIRIRRLALGNPGDVKPVGESVSELRIDYGPGYRVYFEQQGDVCVILPAGGDKSSQEKDIRRAKALAREL
jgi:putative addiction module killer protein